MFQVSTSPSEHIHTRVINCIAGNNHEDAAVGIPVSWLTSTDINRPVLLIEPSSPMSCQTLRLLPDLRSTIQTLLEIRYDLCSSRRKVVNWLLSGFGIQRLWGSWAMLCAQARPALRSERSRAEWSTISLSLRLTLIDHWRLQRLYMSYGVNNNQFYTSSYSHSQIVMSDASISD